MVWVGSLLTMIPTLVLSQLIPMKTPGKFKCREVWPDVESERGFNIYLDVVLLVIPLLIMIIVYSLIARKLCTGSKLNFSKGRRSEIRPMAIGNKRRLLESGPEGKGNSDQNYSKKFQKRRRIVELLTSSSDEDDTSGERYEKNIVTCIQKIRKVNRNSGKEYYREIERSALSNPERQYLDPLKPSSSNGMRRDFRTKMPGARSRTMKSTTLRGTYDKNQAAKIRVVRMLFVVVVEFFVCWTPLYVVNTWALYDAKSVYTSLGYVGMAAIYLMAYFSSCCNPLTYCFMHKKYRQGFLAVIGCKKNKRWHFGGQSSERSGTMVSVFSTRAGSVRSETVDRITATSAC
ncbi:cholecystokinin receptor-like [Argiope bruennichi]|uniref:cholecystokinin receptor-like n=1 Tax=Argiope bruennichi TaxID=94029 RepID=UPI002494C6BC|nr:cholecystokinin receptor-like [Argiope bruennichi]